MNPEYDPSAKVEVIYDDKVTLESSYEVEILIVKHVDQNCLEIFAYDPNLHKESNRLYVNSRKVRSKLNRKDVEERASSLQIDEVNQEVYLEHLNQVTSDLSVEFLLNRLHVDSEALASSRCVLFLSSSDHSTNDPLIARLSSIDTPVFQYVVKPTDVKPFVLDRSDDEEKDDEPNKEDDPDSSADEFPTDDNDLRTRPSIVGSPGSDKGKSKLQSLSQKKSFSCCNDINILWEEKEETGGILSISEMISQSNNTAELSSSTGDVNSSGNKSRSNSKPHIEPAARRSSFDSVVHSLASRVLAPLFPEGANSSSSSKGSGVNTLDAGITPKRRSTFSIFQTAKAKGMHGENYKASMKLAPLEPVPTTPTGSTSISQSSGGLDSKLSSPLVLSPPRIFGSSSTMGNSRSGSEATMPGLSPGSAKESPLAPVKDRKTLSKKKLSHHHIKNYL